MGINFSGIASGLDTESITNQLMTIERQPLVKLQQKSGLLGTKKSLLLSMNTKLLSFYKVSKSLMSGLDNIWGQKKAAVSNSDILGISVTAEADIGSYQIKVNKLAQSHTVASSKLASSTNALYLSGRFYVNGKEIQVVNSDSLQSIKNKINNTAGIGAVATVIDNTLRIKSSTTGDTQLTITDEFAVSTKSALSSDIALMTGTVVGNAAPGKYDFVINYLAQKHEVRSDAVVDPSAALGLAGTAVINGQTVNILVTDSLNDVKDKINGASAGVSASIDAANMLSIQSQTWGAGGEIVASDTVGNVFQTLGILNVDNATYKNTVFEARDSDFSVNGTSYSRSENTFTDVVDGLQVTLSGTGTGNISVSSSGAVLRVLEVLNNDGSIKSELVQAQNAEFEIDGQVITRSTNTISDVMSNATITLKSVSASPVTVTISQDDGTVKSKIKEWVDTYNSAIQMISDKLTEKPIASPKNESERNKGVLYNDYLLSSLKLELRQIMGGAVTSQPLDTQLLEQIGININRDGTLTINDSKLSNALASNPDKVEQLFTADATTYSDPAGGIAKRMELYLANITNATRGEIFKSTITIDRQIEVVSRSISKWEKQLERVEAQYKKKFSDMEKALQAMQAQSNWLSSQLSGGARSVKLR